MSIRHLAHEHRYLITTSPDGTVRLSRLGPWGWGNIPHECEESAERAAAAGAGKHPFTIQRKRLRM